MELSKAYGYRFPPGVTTMGSLAPLLDIIQFLQLTSCFCFLFNYYFETHMAYFGSTSGSGNSKLKSIQGCSWYSQASRTWGPCYTHRFWRPSKHTAWSKHHSPSTHSWKNGICRQTHKQHPSTEAKCETNATSEHHHCRPRCSLSPPLKMSVEWELQY